MLQEEENSLGQDESFEEVFQNSPQALQATNLKSA